MSFDLSEAVHGWKLDDLLDAKITRSLEATTTTTWEQFEAMLQPGERLFQTISTGDEDQCRGDFIIHAETLKKHRELGIYFFGKDKLAQWTNYYAVRTSN